MVTDIEIIEACKNSDSMSKACSKVKLHWRTFRKRAIDLNVFNPNKCGAGIKKSKKIGKDSFSLIDILEGKHPQYQSNKLRIRILAEGIKEHRCEVCNLTEWNEIPIPLEINHIDGNRHNHLLKNIELICPNCHAQTPTYRGKNVKR